MLKFATLLLLCVTVNSKEDSNGSTKELERLERLLERLEMDVRSMEGVSNSHHSDLQKPEEALAKKIRAEEEQRSNKFDRADIERLLDLDPVDVRYRHVQRQQPDTEPTTSTTTVEPSAGGDSTTTTSASSDSPTEESISDTTTTTSAPSSSSSPSSTTEIPTVSSQVTQSGRHDDDSSEDSSEDDDKKLIQPLKSLLDALRARIEVRCATLGEQCGFHHNRMTCCRGLSCSSDWSGTCEVDCVAEGQSCRENWFCCDGRHCMPAAAPTASANTSSTPVARSAAGYTCQ